MEKVDKMLLALPLLFLVCPASAAIAPQAQQASAETSGFQQFSPHTTAFVASRATSARFFTLNGTEKFAAPLGIEQYGLAKIIMNENRPIDTYILNGNTLLAENRNGSCYVNPDNGHLACEDIPDSVPHQCKIFGLAANGTLVYNGTANWWACPAQNPGTYDIYYWARRISPYCKVTQLQSAQTPKMKRLLLLPSVEMVLAEEPNEVASRAVKTCAFHMRITDFKTFAKENEKFNHTTYIWVGKRLGTGPNGFHYCYINSKTRRLDCADKTNKEMLENFHNIDFSINPKGYLMHNGSENWTMCKTSKGWEGPYDNQKLSDSTCQAMQVQLMVATIAGHDCRLIAKFGNSASRALISRAEITADKLFQRCTFEWETVWGPEGNPYSQYWVPESEFSLSDGRLTLIHPSGLGHLCYVKAENSGLICGTAPPSTYIPTVFSIDPMTRHLWHGQSDEWYDCWGGSSPMFIARPPLGEKTCFKVHIRAKILNCAGGARPSTKLNPRSLKSTPPTPSPKCPSNLEDTLFKSPILVVPVSSENKTQAMGNIDKIIVTPTQNTLFNFVIPYAKPYFNKTCALLLLLPDIQSLAVDYQAVAPGLSFSVLEGTVDEQTTWDRMPASRPLISKVMPHEIKPGRNNFITTFPCDSGTVKSFMISSRGGLSMVVKQGGVPNETGLHLVPCV